MRENLARTKKKKKRRTGQVVGHEEKNHLMESEIKLAALLLRFRLWLGFVSPNGLRCRSGLIVYESEWHCLETSID